MQIVPIRDLKDTVSIERRCVETGEPVFVTKNGYGKLVVMDIELFNKLLKDSYEAKLINEALTQIKDKNNLIDGEKVKSEMLSRYEK